MQRDNRYRMKIAAVISILLLPPAIDAAASQDRIASAALPALAAALEDIQGAAFCGEPVPFDNQDVRERFEKEMLLSLWNRPQVLLWLKRASRYMPVIEEILAEYRMPEDLKYIAVIESALRPHAGSGKGAIGFWQFMPDTARRYGLVVDARRDERRNVFDSTRAAVFYFLDLFERFGGWTLAAAAYNLGEARLEAEIAEQQVDDYYDLYLPLETQRYVLRVVSAKLILSDPERYGFFLPPESLYPPLVFERLAVECPQETPIRIVAAAADTTFKRIKDLNPELRGHHLPAGAAYIRIPATASPAFAKRFRQLRDNYFAELEGRVYVVRQGDNLSLIADRFGVSLSSLLIWNRIDPRRTLYPGERLVIYPDMPDSADEGAAEAVTVD